MKLHNFNKIGTVTTNKEQKMEVLTKYFSDAEIAEMTEDQKSSMIYGISQGYDPNDVASNDYVQKTDDCDWVF